MRSLITLCALALSITLSLGSASPASAMPNPFIDGDPATVPALTSGEAVAKAANVRVSVTDSDHTEASATLVFVVEGDAPQTLTWRCGRGPKDGTPHTMTLDGEPLKTRTTADMTMPHAQRLERYDLKRTLASIPEKGARPLQAYEGSAEVAPGEHTIACKASIRPPGNGVDGTYWAHDLAILRSPLASWTGGDAITTEVTFAVPGASWELTPQGTLAASNASDATLTAQLKGDLNSPTWAVARPKLPLHISILATLLWVIPAVVALGLAVALGRRVARQRAEGNGRLAREVASVLGVGALGLALSLGAMVLYGRIVAQYGQTTFGFNTSLMISGITYALAVANVPLIGVPLTAWWQRRKAGA